MALNLLKFSLKWFRTRKFPPVTVFWCQNISLHYRTVKVQDMLIKVKISRYREQRTNSLTRFTFFKTLIALKLKSLWIWFKFSLIYNKFLGRYAKNCIFHQNNIFKVSAWLFNPILHTAWLDNHALTLKSNSAKYYFHEKSRFLHTFLKFCCESRKIYVKFKNILLSVL